MHGIAKGVIAGFNPVADEKLGGLKKLTSAAAAVVVSSPCRDSNERAVTQPAFSLRPREIFSSSSEIITDWI